MKASVVTEIEELAHIIQRAASHLSGDLDREQIELFDLAFCQAELEAVRALSTTAQSTSDERHLAALDYFTAQVIANARARLSLRPGAYGLSHGDLDIGADALTVMNPEELSRIGTLFLEQGLPQDVLDDEHRIMRDTFHDFADEVVAPLAEDIHRHDRIVPDEILTPLKEMGCFGLSVPMRYGGLKPDNHEDSLGMVVVTEELSRGSLGAAGSLITRPEIMARAILEGGTDEQKQRWLPGIAQGDPLCAISVTEPNTGSDVASVNLRATRTSGGWLLNGGKTWCTFAGKAGYILVLARTDADVHPPHRGLSLFVVEKPCTDDHDFEYSQPEGGRVSGRAIATLGYRGMHSYEMFYDNFFVPDSNLIGAEEGQGRGFYYTMRGFMGGRLQTAARACGLMRAAFESATSYASERVVFGKPVAHYPLSLAKIAGMGSHIIAGKAFTRSVAELIDAGEGAMEASLVKLLTCRSAEWVTRESLQLYGGMGYAEETDVSRYFADARVLSIFEGAEETLAIRVVGKSLVDSSRSG